VNYKSSSNGLNFKEVTKLELSKFVEFSPLLSWIFSFTLCVFSSLVLSFSLLWLSSFRIQASSMPLCPQPLRKFSSY